MQKKRWFSVDNFKYNAEQKSDYCLCEKKYFGSGVKL